MRNRSNNCIFAAYSNTEIMNNTNISFGLAVTIVLAAASTRFLPHPPNFTAIGSLALFGGVYFSGKHLSWLIPFVTLLLTDIVLNNFVYHTEFTWYSTGTYLAFGLIYLIGRLLNGRISAQTVFAGSFTASMIFFLVTNIFCWQSMPIYSKDLTGVISCYAAALPYFWNTLAGDLTFSAVMFGTFYLSIRQTKLV